MKCLYDLHRYSLESAVRGSMLKGSRLTTQDAYCARSEISQVFWNMVLCPLTVADILEELAVSIFSHLLTMHHTEQFNLCDGDCFFQFLHE